MLHPTGDSGLRHQCESPQPARRKEPPCSTRNASFPPFSSSSFSLRSRPPSALARHLRTAQLFPPLAKPWHHPMRHRPCELSSRRATGSRERHTHSGAGMLVSRRPRTIALDRLALCFTPPDCSTLQSIPLTSPLGGPRERVDGSRSTRTAAMPTSPSQVCASTRARDVARETDGRRSGGRLMAIACATHLVFSRL